MDYIRCFVESWAEFGLSSRTNVKLLSAGTAILISTGNDVLVFSSKDKRLTAVLQLETPVTSLVLTEQHLYILCEKDGVYCSSVPQARSPSPTALSDQEPVLQRLPEDSIVLKDPTIHSFLLEGDTMVTVSLEDTAWTLRVYRVSNGSFSKRVSLRKLAEHQVAAVKPPHSMSVDKGTRVRDSRVSLSCIYPSGGRNLSGSSADFLLEPVLFTLLFGVDAALVNSPVILCGLPDGRLCYLPLLVSACSLGQRTGLRMLHSLEQPVAYVGTSSVTMETSGHAPRSLVVVGERGRVLVLTAYEAVGEEKVVRFSEFSVRGPVFCACSSSSHVYYSTATDLLSLKLNITNASLSSLSSSTSSSDQSGQTDSPTPTTVSLNVCGVIAMALHLGDLTEGGAVEILALSLRGRLQKIRLPDGKTGGGMAQLPASLAGQRVKDLLAGIGNVWERASALKSTIQQRNESLRRLNQVFNICSLMQFNQEAERQTCDRQQRINCHGVTSWSYVLQDESLMLTCTLENSSAFDLEHGWCLCVHVYAMSGSPMHDQENSSRNYTFPVHKLSSGQKLNVTLPLGSSHSLSLPLTVHCSIMFCLHSLGSPEDLKEPENTGITSSSLPSQQSNCIFLPLNTLTVDLLGALRLDTNASLSVVSQQSPAPPDAVSTFLRSRGMEMGDSTGPGQRSSPYTVVVKLSAELLRTRVKAPGPGEPGAGASALRWLLSGCPGAQGLEGLQTSTVTGRCPAGHAARMTVKEVTLTDVCTDGPLTVLEVQIESFSMATVCGLHYAVLRRIQALPKLTSQESRVQLRAESVKQAKQHSKVLYKALQETLEPCALGVSSTSSRSSHRLLSIYQQLRENPLLIL